VESIDVYRVKLQNVMGFIDAELDGHAISILVYVCIKRVLPERVVPKVIPAMRLLENALQLNVLMRLILMLFVLDYMVLAGYAIRVPGNVLNIHAGLLPILMHIVENIMAILMDAMLKLVCALKKDFSIIHHLTNIVKHIKGKSGIGILKMKNVKRLHVTSTMILMRCALHIMASSIFVLMVNAAKKGEVLHVKVTRNVRRV